eukprot:scaffold56714_cov33-Phaeocystis_antarctica.AAC.2
MAARRVAAVAPRVVRFSASREPTVLRRHAELLRCCGCVVPLPRCSPAARARPRPWVSTPRAARCAVRGHGAGWGGARRRDPVDPARSPRAGRRRGGPGEGWS